MIRPVRGDDLDALSAISLATGHEGGDASHLYTDPKLTGLIYAAPYALLEPALAFVVEDSEGVAGFAVGVTDTTFWEARLEERWWPSLRPRYPMPEGDPATWTADQRRAAMIHHPSKTPPEIARHYPAHLHVNLLPRVQGRGIGTTLLARWIEESRASAVHVAVNRFNKGGLAFWSRRGFTDLAPEGASPGRTVWKGRTQATPVSHPS
jgi:GNAT superfamily N-acetyltransferase